MDRKDKIGIFIAGKCYKIQRLNRSLFLIKNSTKKGKIKNTAGKNMNLFRMAVFYYIYKPVTYLLIFNDLSN
jgi:hypothetical protein